MNQTQIDFERIKGFSKLTVEQQQFFIRMHHSHMKAMGTDNQKKYSAKNIKKVAWDKEENTVNVYYQDIWWHYGRQGWY